MARIDIKDDTTNVFVKLSATSETLILGDCANSMARIEPVRVRAAAEVEQDGVKAIVDCHVHMATGPYREYSYRSTDSVDDIRAAILAVDPNFKDLPEQTGIAAYGCALRHCIG